MPRCAPRLVERKVLSVLSGSTLLECFVSEVLDGGRYKRHVEQVRARLARMRRDARAALDGGGHPIRGRRRRGHVPLGTGARARTGGRTWCAARVSTPSCWQAARCSPRSSGCEQWLRFNAAHSNSPPLVQFLRESLRAA